MDPDYSREDYYSHISVMRGLLCEKLLYLYKNKPEEKEGTWDLGKIIGRRNSIVKDLGIKSLGSGIDITDSEDYDIKSCIAKTKELLDKKHGLLFRPYFLYDYIYTRVDAVRNTKDGLIIYDIQVRTSVKKNQFDSLGYQMEIIKSAGYEIHDIVVLYLDPDYTNIKRADHNNLFLRESVLDQITINGDKYKNNIEYIRSKFPPETEPESILGKHCFKGGICPFFRTCFPEIPEENIFSLGGMHLLDKLELFENGKTKIEDIPDSYNLNDFSRIQIESSKKDEIIVNRNGLEDFISKLTFPLYFTDFEAVQAAVPVYKNTSPFQMILFQYYLVKYLSLTEKEEYSFLPDANEDPREKFIKTFMERTEGEGSIIVFDTSSEKKMLREIGKVFPDYNDSIENRIERMLDLKEPFEKLYFYHPEMKGSKTLKSIIKAIRNDNGYHEMEIGDGGSASILYEIFLYEGKKYPTEEFRNDLIKYCKKDVVSMVEILVYLYKIIHE